MLSDMDSNTEDIHQEESSSQQSGLEWPKQQIVESGPWVAIVSVVGLIASLSLAGVSQIPFATRIDLIVVVLLLSALLCATITFGKRALVMWRRARVYDDVTQKMWQLNVELQEQVAARDRWKALATLLLKVLDEYNIPSFNVERVALQGDENVLVIEDIQALRTLEAGHLLMVADPHGWRMLGLFEVTEINHRRRVCYARAIAVHDDEWWTAVARMVSARELRHLDAVAFLLSNKKDDRINGRSTTA